MSDHDAFLSLLKRDMYALYTEDQLSRSRSPRGLRSPRYVDSRRSVARKFVTTAIRYENEVKGGAGGNRNRHTDWISMQNIHPLCGQNRVWVLMLNLVVRIVTTGLWLTLRPKFILRFPEFHHFSFLP